MESKLTTWPDSGTPGYSPASTESGVRHPSGAEAQRLIARFRARIVARYHLIAVPGRPEELRQRETDLRVSIGYGCRSIRVRTQQGRVWLGWQDYQIAEGQYSTLYKQLDPHFGFLQGQPSVPLALLP